MRAYHDLLLYLKELFESVNVIGDNTVRTITTDGFIEMDNFRKTIYPIVDFYIVGSPLSITNTAEVQFNVDITVLDIRDVNKEQVIDKIYWNDNRHDNWNLCYAILKQAFNKAVRQDNDFDISLVSSTEAERITLGKKNGLDGWSATWTMSVPDINTKIC